MITTKANNVDEYIAGFPGDIQKKLEQMRATISKAAPGAEETISYSMPAFKLKGILVYFAAFKNHIGFYPTASAIAAFKKEISKYKWSKGAIQFPTEMPLPLELVTEIVKFKVKANMDKAEAKKMKGKN